MQFPMQFERQYKGPLDADLKVDLLTERDALLVSPTKYSGMVVYVLETDKLYYLNATEDAFVAVGGDVADVDGSTLAEHVANTAVGGVVNGQTFPIGTTLDSFIEALIVKTYYPTITEPTSSMSVSLGNSVESGTTGDITLTISFNRGAITGDDDGGIWNPSLKQDDRAGAANDYEFDTVSNGVVNNKTVLGYVVIDGSNSWSGKVSYDEGPQPLDSKGANYGSPLSAGFINVSKAITGKRNTFYGVDVEPVDSAAIRTLSNAILGAVEGNTFTINIPSGSDRVVFAYPATMRDVSSVKYVEGMNAEVKTVFTKTTVDVEGANGYTAVTYKVYEYVPAGPFTQTVNYQVTI